MSPAPILLVDDRRENLLALEAILAPLGRPLVTAQSGEEALRVLLRRDVALILLDVQMPALDGFETARLIKERERTKSVPIIFLTAISKDAKHVFRGYESGAVDYIFKPLDPEILRSKVAVFLDLHDKTERLKQHERALAERALAQLQAESEERYRQLADAMPQIVWTSTPEGRASYFNRRWFEYTGLPEDRAGADSWRAVVHPDDLPRTNERRRATLASGGTFEVEYRFRRADGVYRWHLGRAVPIQAEDGSIAYWVGTATDIDDHKRAEEAQRFLLDAGAALAGSLDYRRTLADVAKLAVPRVADWCAVHVVEADGSLQPVALEHADPRKLAFALELRDRYPPGESPESGPAAVVRTGEPELVPAIDDELRRRSARDGLHYELLRELGLRSYVCAPLRSRGRTLGAITLVAAESGRTYGQEDLRLAQELGRRAAVAIDNARLYRQAEERAQAARVLASIGDGVFLVDDEGVVRLWNAAAEAITGVPAVEAVGQRAAAVLPGWEDLAPRIPVTRAGEQGRPESLPVETGGRELWLSISAVALADGTAYAFRDLTEERALEELKADFVATVSHELRTPLAAIYGAAQTIRRPDLELDEAVRDELLGVVADESSRLASIVNDLLLASHLDSGRLPVTIERTNVRALARSVVESARARLPEGIELRLELPRRLPPVAADPGQLRQVLVNLLDNAIKYSPAGGVVEVRAETVDRAVRVAVRDEGLGIPVSEQRRIFEKFYRLDPNMTRGIGGTGLGLYICKELVRRVNGGIWVKSRLGHGSTFYVEIPAVAQARKRSRPAAVRAR